MMLKKNIKKIHDNYTIYSDKFRVKEYIKEKEEIKGKIFLFEKN